MKLSELIYQLSEAGVTGDPIILFATNEVPDATYTVDEILINPDFVILVSL